MSSSTLRPFLHQHVTRLELSPQCRGLDIVRAIEKTPVLAHLTLRGCLGPSANVKAQKIAKLTGMLLSLDVSYNDCLSWDGLAAILSANGALTSLNVSWCGGLSSLRELPETLEHLDASHCSRMGPELSLSSRSLASLSLSHTPVSALTLDCSNLSTLLLTHCEQLEHIHSEKPHQKLTLLSLASCRCPLNLCQAFPCLLQLDLSDACIPSELPSTLRSLVIDDCSEIPACISQLPSLSSLSMSHVPFKPETFPFLPSVAKLVSQRCKSVPPLGCFLALNDLDVSWCDGVTPDFLATLPLSLSCFRVYGCRHVRRCDLDALKARIGNLLIYHNSD